MSASRQSVEPQSTPDPSRQLISPPPEETLSLRRVSRSTPLTPLPSYSNVTAAVPNPKRKRPIAAIVYDQVFSSPGSIEATPNPKPRKQPKQYSRNVSSVSPTKRSMAMSHGDLTTPTKSSKQISVKSPHVDNPQADFIPLILDLGESNTPTRRPASAKARRGTTPIPPYEPPTVVYSPPREVIMTPATGGSSKRRSTQKKPRKSKVTAVITVKKEPPFIDLKAPIPPPSPTEDPILLLGPPVTPARRPSKQKKKEVKEIGIEANIPTENKSNTNTNVDMRDLFVVDNEIVHPLPPTSSPMDGAGSIDPVFQQAWNPPIGSEDTTDFDMDLDEGAPVVLPLDLINIPSDGAWTESDEEENGDEDPELRQGEGEFTGRWQMMKVRTKADPPSSATKVRQEKWGRPVSPFPYRKRLSTVPQEEEEEEVEEGEVVQLSKLDFNSLDAKHNDSEGDDAVVQDEKARRRQEERMSNDREDVNRRLDAGEPPLDLDEIVSDGDLAEEEEVRRLSSELDPEDGDEDRGVAQMGNPHEAELSQLLTPAPSTETIQYPSPPESSQPVQPILSKGNSIDQHEAATETDSDEDELEEVLQMSMLPDEETESETDDPLPEQILGFLDSPAGPSESFDSDPPSETSLLSDELDPPEVTPTDPISPIEEMPDVPVTSEMSEMLDFAVAEGASDDLEDDDSDDIDVSGLGVVKITSADPRAAARAAAILKQHNYDCFTKMLLKKSAGDSPVVTLNREDKRRRASSFGVKKASADATRNRRRTFGGVIGDLVYEAGSPVTTLPDLLREAEMELSREIELSRDFNPDVLSNLASTPKPPTDIYKTPLSNRQVPITPQLEQHELEEEAGEKNWTRDDWKQLDGCFTDERLAIGAEMGLHNTDGTDGLASADEVDLQNVVERFVGFIGGYDVLDKYGEAWSRENLLDRAQVLLKKQRTGKLAPPTTPALSPAPSSTSRRMSFMQALEFTPIMRALRPVLPPPVDSGLFKEIPAETPIPKNVPPTSFTSPGYSRLLQEAVAISQEPLPCRVTQTRSGGSSAETSASSISVDASTEPETSFTSAGQPQVPLTPQKTHVPELPASLGKRVTGFLTSYLSSITKGEPRPTRLMEDLKTSLPVPPLEVLDKPRGPVKTPSKPKHPRPKVPKEFVQLHPAPPPPPLPSKIPRPSRPKRLVDLHPPKKPIPPKREPAKPRRSSGSVKDLVKDYEERDAAAQRSSIGPKRSVSGSRLGPLGLATTANPAAGLRRVPINSKASKPRPWRP